MHKHILFGLFGPFRRMAFLLSPLHLLIFILLVGCAAPTSGVFFDEERAQEVEVGMDQELVTELLGTPYAIEPYIGGEKWIWSYSTKDVATSFVVTIENGSVNSISGYHEGKR